MCSSAPSSAVADNNTKVLLTKVSSLDLSIENQTNEDEGDDQDDNDTDRHIRKFVLIKNNVILEV